MDLKTCPSCGQSMEKGFIIAPAGMFWNQIVSSDLIHVMSEVKRVRYGITYTRPSLGESICPSSDPRMNWIRVRFPYLEGFRCRTCSLFIYSCDMDDDELKSPNGEKKPNGKVLECPSCHAQYFYLDSVITQGSVSCQNCLYEFQVVS